MDDSLPKRFRLGDMVKILPTAIADGVPGRFVGSKGVVTGIREGQCEWILSLRIVLGGVYDWEAYQSNVVSTRKKPRGARRRRKSG